MKTKTYRGRDRRAVMSQIREELGEEAVILDSRESESHQFEIEVGIEGHLAETAIQNHSANVGALHSMNLVNHYDANSHANHFGNVMHDTVQQALQAQGLSHVAIDGIVRALPVLARQSNSMDQIVATGLEGLIKFDGSMPRKCKAVALVGPTGVGKTTTIAKLAARLRQALNLKIGLIAADSFRVGAGFQLHTYASLMNMPCRALNPDKPFVSELKTALEAYKGLDLVLIDTAGCSARDAARIEKMESDFSGFKNVERLLVLAAPSNDVDLQTAAAAFSKVRIDRVILSKLDESGFIGPVLNTVMSLKRPVAFLTTGQQVPEDIEPASARRLGWMLTRKMH